MKKRTQAFEKPLTNDEINDTLNIMMSNDGMFTIGARRYEQSNDRYDHLIRKNIR